MEKLHRLNLQFFADGGGAGAGAGTGSEGGDGGTAEGATSGVSEMEKRIPERAKEAWRQAVAKTQGKSQKQAETKQTTTTKQDGESPKADRPTYEDLIKGEYKADHNAYMEKTIHDRLKGTNEKLAKMQGALGKVGLKYGLDTNSETFMDDVMKHIDEDNEFYESYAMEHDVPIAEAKKMIEMEQRVQFMNQQEAMRQEQEAHTEALRILRENAAKTKAEFPNFDLDKEMQNEQFRNMCAITNGDTSAAYWALHHNEIVRSRVAMSTEQAKAAMANSIASGQARPTETGLSQRKDSFVPPQPDFRSMTAAQMKEYAMARMKR